jgi:hypothetical protein
MKTILVQMSDRHWTMPALHLACALARNANAKVVLLQLIHVRHPSYLGTTFGLTPPTLQEYADMDEYKATAEDYGVEMTIQPMQCISTFDAVVDAVHSLDADAVFANVPESRLPFWQKFQTWHLQHRIAPRQLFVIDKLNQSIDRLPSIVIKSAYALQAREESDLILS